MIYVKKKKQQILTNYICIIENENLRPPQLFKIINKFKRENGKDNLIATKSFGTLRNKIRRVGESFNW